MTTEIEPAMARARARARQLRQLYQHIATYGLVMVLLVVIDVAGGAAEGGLAGLDWAFWPALGWGLFVAAHAVRVWLPVGDWEDRKTRELYERERERGARPS